MWNLFRGFWPQFRAFVLGLMLVGVATLFLLVTLFTLGKGNQALTTAGTILAAMALLGGLLLLLRAGGVLATEDKGLRRQLDQKSREARSAEAQLTRERGKKLQVVALAPMLDLGVLKAECKIHESYDLAFVAGRRDLIEFSAADPALVDRRFLGTLSVHVTARLGVDLTRVRARISPDGVTMEYVMPDPAVQGFDGIAAPVWEVKVPLKRVGVFNESWQVCKDEAEYAWIVQRKQDEFLGRLKEGPDEVGWLLAPVAEKAETILSTLIKAAGYQALRVNHLDATALPLQRLLAGDTEPPAT